MARGNGSAVLGHLDSCRRSHWGLAVVAGTVMESAERVVHHLAGSYHRGSQFAAAPVRVGILSAEAVESLSHLGNRSAVVADVAAADLESQSAVVVYLPEERLAVGTVAVAVVGGYTLFAWGIGILVPIVPLER